MNHARISIAIAYYSGSLDGSGMVQYGCAHYGQRPGGGGQLSPDQPDSDKEGGWCVYSEGLVQYLVENG